MPRPGIIFGPGERGNYTRLVNALRKGYFAYPGRRDTIKSCGYVDELLRSIEFALDRNDTYVLYNFAYPDFSTTEEIVKLVGNVTGTAVNPPTLPFGLKTPTLIFELKTVLGNARSLRANRAFSAQARKARNPPRPCEQAMCNSLCGSGPEARLGLLAV